MDKLSNNRGSALVLVVLAFLVVSVLGAAIYSLTTAEYKFTMSDKRNQSVYYVAEAGIPYIIEEIKRDMNDIVDSSHSESSFYQEFESRYVGTTITWNDFEKNLSDQPPEVEITLEHIPRNPNMQYAQPGRDYQIVSTGTNGSNTKKVGSVLTVSWQGTEVEDSFGFLDDVSLFGSKFQFAGDSLYGEGLSMVIGGVTTADMNQGNFSGVSNIYFDGDIDIDGGSTSFGNPNNPGNLYVDGNLRMTNGNRNIYGTVYVKGNARLKDAIFHGDVYVNGNVELEQNGPTMKKKLFYTGTLDYPSWYTSTTLAPYEKVDSVPSFYLPEITVYARPNTWYAQNGYTMANNVNTGVIADNGKYYVVNDFVSSHYTSPAGTVVVVSEQGNINISGWRQITGVLVAPNGYVTLGIDTFTGVIIAKGVINANQGGMKMYLKTLPDFFDLPSSPLSIVQDDNMLGEGGGGMQGTAVDLTFTPYKELPKN